MTVWDITRELGRETPPYLGDSPFAARQEGTVSTTGSNTRRLEMSSHTGTHVDAPRHFFDEGKALGDFPIERFMPTALVVEVDAEVAIEASDLEGLDTAPDEALLLKTHNSLMSLESFDEQWVHISADAARWIVKHGISLVGLDTYSVDAFDDRDQKAHHVLLGADVLILENIVLRDVAPGRYSLSCLPLRLKDADASPVRATLEAL